MFKISVIAVMAVILTGCASQPLTPYQQQVLMGYMQAQQNNYNQQMANIRAAQQANQANQPTNCLTTYNSNGTAYTTCH